MPKKYLRTLDEVTAAAYGCSHAEAVALNFRDWIDVAWGVPSHKGAKPGTLWRATCRACGEVFLRIGSGGGRFRCDACKAAGAVAASCGVSGREGYMNIRPLTLAERARQAAERTLLGPVESPPADLSEEEARVWSAAYQRHLEAMTAPEGVEGGA